MIDLDTVEGETVQKVFNHIRFEVSRERMAEWMKKLVRRKNRRCIRRDERSQMRPATEEEKGNLNRKRCDLTILKVEEATLPELDDEFAKKVGAADVAHMRQSITDLLNNQADEKVQNELREQVNDFLIEQLSI